MPTSVFAGFPKDTFKYLSDLGSNNSKEWFDQNRARYEKVWKEPAFGLTNALAAPMAKLSPALKAEARINGSVRRINRDVRFSKDKTPYNAMLHLIFWAGSHPNKSPAMHFVLSPDGIGYGAGVFGLGPAALAALRSRIIDKADLTTLLAALEKAENVNCTFDEPDLKNLPKGYAADGDWEHLLRRKDLVVRTMQNQPAPNWVLTSECTDRVMDLTRSLMPLIRWLSPLEGSDLVPRTRP